MTSQKRRRGFTLIEILLAISILVVLVGAIGIVTFRNVKKGADKKTAELLVGRIKQSIDQFNTDMNRYPTDEEKFDILITAPDDDDEKKKWNGPYLKEKPLDPWGEEIQYEVVEDSEGTTEPYKIWSKGPDKDSDTDDDIKSWKDAE